MDSRSLPLHASRNGSLVTPRKGTSPTSCTETPSLILASPKPGISEVPRPGYRKPHILSSPDHGHVPGRCQATIQLTLCSLQIRQYDRWGRHCTFRHVKHYYFYFGNNKAFESLATIWPLFHDIKGPVNIVTIPNFNHPSETSTNCNISLSPSMSSAKKYPGKSLTQIQPYAIFHQPSTFIPLGIPNPSNPNDLPASHGMHGKQKVS